MTLLIINLDKFIGNAQAWRDAFREQLPDLPIRIWPAAIGVGFLAIVSYRWPRTRPLRGNAATCQ